MVDAVADGLQSVSISRTRLLETGSVLSAVNYLKAKSSGMMMVELWICSKFSNYMRLEGRRIQDTHICMQ